MISLKKIEYCNDTLYVTNETKKETSFTDIFYLYLFSPLYLLFMTVLTCFFSPQFAKQCFIIIFFFLIVIIWLSVVSFGGDFCVYTFYNENNGVF